MRKPKSKKELDSYIEDLKARQRNLIWPDVLRGGRRSTNSYGRERVTLLWFSESGQ